MTSMASIIDIFCNCDTNSHDNGYNIDPNCNFQFYTIIKDGNGIEYYNLNTINYFYKGINKPTILDYDDITNPFKNKPSWMSDITTALIYYNSYAPGSQRNIFAFKSTKELKLFNLLSINNLTILYNKIVSDLRQTQTQLSADQQNQTLINKVQILINYIKTIELSTGFNVTIDEQNVLASPYKSKYNEYIDSSGDIIKYRINNNLHSSEKIDLNRWSFYDHDNTLVDILILYFPYFDGYCGYRTKTLSHNNNSFHEEICIFNPESCIRRATDNPLDASNPNNFVAIHSYLRNKTPTYKITTGDAMVLHGGELNERSIYMSFDEMLLKVTELTNKLKTSLCKDSQKCPDINNIYKNLCVDLIKYKLDNNENNNHMYYENNYKFDINNIFNHLHINKILKLYKLFLENKEEKEEKEKNIIFNLLNKYIEKIIRKSTIITTIKAQ